MGDVLEVGVMLTGELVAESRGYENARRKVGVLVDSQTVAIGEGVGVQGGEEIGFVVLGVLPVDEIGGKVGMQCVVVNLEEGSGAVQNLRVDAVKLMKGRDVPDDPNVITVEKHDFACVFVGAA